MSSNIHLPEMDDLDLQHPLLNILPRGAPMGAHAFTRSDVEMRVSLTCSTWIGCLGWSRTDMLSWTWHDHRRYLAAAVMAEF